MSQAEWDLLQDKIDLIRRELADFLVDAKVANSIQKISSVKNLGPKLGNEIAKIVREIVLAELSITGLASTIGSRLGVAQNEAGEIANLIITEVLAPVLGDVEKSHPAGSPSYRSQTPPSGSPRQPSPSLHEQNIGNVVDLRDKK